MKILVSASARFVLTPNNELWTPTFSLNYDFWCRYLSVFDHVELLVRAQYSERPPKEWIRASGPQISPIVVPYFVGPLGYISKYTQINRLIDTTISGAEAVQLRIPCALGTRVWRKIKGKRPYGVEVVGDPYDVFAPRANKHPARVFFRWWFSHNLRLQCAGAVAAAYVTENILQQRYPPQPSAYTTHFSSVELLEDAFIEETPTFYRSESEVTIVHIGTMDQLYKGQDDLIRAVHLCLVNGLEIRLILIGDGRYRSEYEKLVTDLNLEDEIVFLGQLPGRKAVRTQLDKADLFVLPSRQEGLPRALIEAMARGLPCIGSKVGGIPELLPEDAMFPANDPSILAQKIMEVLSNPDRMCEMSKHNLQVASVYKAEFLQERKRKFYQYVHDTTLEYMQRDA